MTPTSGSLQPAGTVLIVEDEPGVREMMRQVLERAGLRVLLAAGGADGIRVAREWAAHLDVVLSDFVMPGVNGDAVLRSVHDAHPEAALVLMSGYAGTPGLDGLPHEVLAKPFSPRDLIGVVSRRIAVSADAPGKPTGEPS